MQKLEQALRQTLPDARIEAVRLPGCNAIRLGLINEDYQTGPLDPEVMQAVIRDPAYWAFCWGSGLALARYLLDRPDRVSGRRVVDLGSGSGIAAIAAALAGAEQVIACDTDPHARLATEMNAAFNNVRVSVQEFLPDHCELLLMADVLYDRSNLPLLALAQSHASEVLIADSRVTELPDRSYREIAQIEALTIPNLGEFDEFRTAHLFHWQEKSQEDAPHGSEPAQPD